MPPSQDASGTSLNMFFTSTALTATYVQGMNSVEDADVVIPPKVSSATGRSSARHNSNRIKNIAYTSRIIFKTI